MYIPMLYLYLYFLTYISLHIYSFYGVSPGVRQSKLVDFGLLLLNADFVSESKTSINYNLPF